MSEPLIPTTPGSLRLDELNATFGVFFIGYIIAMTLYGFTFFRTSFFSFALLFTLVYLFSRDLHLFYSFPQRSLDDKSNGQSDVPP